MRFLVLECEDSAVPAVYVWRSSKESNLVNRLGTARKKEKGDQSWPL